MRAAESAVQTFAGNKTIVVKRFDRMRRDGKLYRVHQEDMCQALGIGPDRKYENDGGPGIPDVMGIVSGSSRRLEDREAFMDAILFNYLILGTDAHAKNYSILHTCEGFILAPLYDIASFAPYVNAQKDERLAMRIDRYYKITQIRRRHFERTAKSCNFSTRNLLERLEALATQLPAVCDQVGQSTIKDGLDPAFIETLIKRLSARSRLALEVIVER
jgi:serine/threonine-protein kinase HipA